MRRTSKMMASDEIDGLIIALLTYPSLRKWNVCKSLKWACGQWRRHLIYIRAFGKSRGRPQWQSHELDMLTAFLPWYVGRNTPKFTALCDTDTMWSGGWDRAAAQTEGKANRPTDRTNGVRQSGKETGAPGERATGGGRAAIHAEIQGAEGGQTDAGTRTIHCKHPLMPKHENYLGNISLLKLFSTVLNKIENCHRVATNIFGNRVLNISRGRCLTWSPLIHCCLGLFSWLCNALYVRLWHNHSELEKSIEQVTWLSAFAYLHHHWLMAYTHPY